MNKNSRLRPLTMDDLQEVLTWRNHPQVRKFMYTQHLISWTEHVQWFKKAQQDPGRHLFIFEQEGQDLGFVNFEHLGGRVVDWGFYLAPHAPSGTGKNMGICAVNHGFMILNLHKICGQALAENKPSINFHLRLGFEHEGLLRQHHFDGQKYHDIYCFGLLASKWRKIQDTLYDPPSISDH